MPIYATKTVFAVQRTIPAILTQPVSNNDILIFNAESGVFSNESIAEAIDISNTGTGSPLASIAGNTISVKSLAGGSNISLVDDGLTVTINNDSTAIVANMTALSALGPTSDVGRSALVIDTGAGQPGLFVWNGSWISAGGSGAGGMSLTHVNFSHSSSSPLSITTLPASAVILTTQVAIGTAFNGSPASTVTVGTPAENNMLMTTDEIDTTQVKSFIDDTYFILPSGGNQQINAYFSFNGATQGAGTIFILYSLT